jgi:hypothetical protein
LTKLALEPCPSAAPAGTSTPVSGDADGDRALAEHVVDTRGEPALSVGSEPSATVASAGLNRPVPAQTTSTPGSSASQDESAWATVIHDRERAGVLVRGRSEIGALHGADGQLDAATLRDGERIALSSLLLFLGAAPRTDWLCGAVALDDDGFILGGRGAGADGILETSVPSVFAVGDVRSGSVKRCAAAVGEGAMVVRFVHERFSGDSHDGPFARAGIAPAAPDTALSDAFTRRLDRGDRGRRDEACIPRLEHQPRRPRARAPLRTGRRCTFVVPGPQNRACPFLSAPAQAGPQVR